MKVLIVTQYFAPEVTAATQRLHPFAAGLAARGHRVEVICEVPSHPRGVVEPSYRGRLTDSRDLDGFRATYVWTHARPSKRARHRIASYASYAAMATAAAAVRERPDVILASSPPLSVGAVGALAAARHRRPWLFDVRDLWPEVAVVLGELRNPRLIAAAERLERRLYASAAAITTPTEPFREDIAARIRDPGKVHVLPNGTTQSWLDVGETEPERADLGLPPDRFVWAYAGNIGIAQGLNTAVEAAEILGDGFQLLLVGDGPQHGRLARDAANLPEGSVAFRGLVQPHLAARFMRAADALLVSLDKQPALRKFVPSKLFDSCAVGRPVIVAAAGESQRLVAESGAGLAVEPGDAVALAAAVRRLRDDSALSARLSLAGRDFAARYLRERQIELLETLLVSIR